MLGREVKPTRSSIAMADDDSELDEEPEVIADASELLGDDEDVKVVRLGKDGWAKAASDINAFAAELSNKPHVTAIDLNGAPLDAPLVSRSILGRDVR